MSEAYTFIGLSLITWCNTLVFALLFHVYIGFPNLLYLFNVYKNFFLSWRRGKLKPLEISKLKSKAYLTWIDDNIHMNNGIYFSEFERGRRDWFFRIGSAQFYQQYNSGFVLSSLTSRFRKEIRPLASFEIHTKLLHYDDLHIYLEQRLVSSVDGMIHCIAYADCSVIDNQRKKRVKTDIFIQFLSLTDTQKKQLCQNPPLSLSHWIDYLKTSSTEIRAEAGLPPKT